MANYLFMNENADSIQLYFEEAGDVVEIKWGSPDYIADKFAQFNVKNAEELHAYFTATPEQAVYPFSHKGKDGKVFEGYTLDKPMPEASEPTMAIVTGKIKQVEVNQYKVAITVETKKGDFTVVRGFTYHDKRNNKLYPAAAKKKKLLNSFGVSDFSELKVGSEITFVQQSAGSNKYYEPAQD